MGGGSAIYTSSYTGLFDLKNSENNGNTLRYPSQPYDECLIENDIMWCYTTTNSYWGDSSSHNLIYPPDAGGECNVMCSASYSSSGVDVITALENGLASDYKGYVLMSLNAHLDDLYIMDDYSGSEIISSPSVAELDTVLSLSDCSIKFKLQNTRYNTSTNQSSWTYSFSYQKSNEARQYIANQSLTANVNNGSTQPYVWLLFIVKGYNRLQLKCGSHSSSWGELDDTIYEHSNDDIVFSVSSNQKTSLFEDIFGNLWLENLSNIVVDNFDVRFKLIK